MAGAAPRQGAGTGGVAGPAAGRRGRVRRWLHGKLRRAPIGADGLARVRARQIYIVPTRTGLFYGLVTFVMLIGSLNYQNNLGLLFSFFLVGLGLVAMHHCWFNLLGLEIQARPGLAVFAGEPARFEVTLRNQRHRPRYDLRVLGGLDPLGPVPLQARDQQALGLNLPTRRRGLMTLSEVEVCTRHPMGLFRAWCLAACRATLTVYPKPAACAPEPQPAAGDARRPAGACSDGSDDYLGPREYRLGDPPRHLDWKALARERGLVVKQFAGDQGLEAWIDWDRVQAVDAEDRIALLARQVLDADEARLRFGLRIPGVEIGLDRGDAQVGRCLTELALFEHGQYQPARRAA